MNITVDDLGPCKKLLRIEIEVERVDAEFEKITREFQRKARIPGFRKGKTPRQIILKNFGPDIETEVKKSLISEAYRDALKEKSLSVIGYPDIEEIQFNKGQALQFAATVETSPTFTMPEYKNLPVKLEKRSVTEEDMERALTALREQHATYADVDRPVQDGDFVVVDYQGTSEGKPLTEYSSSVHGLAEKKDFWIKVKKDSFLPGFTEQLIGAAIGNERTVKVTFPQDFPAKELRGREGVYEVRVKMVKERKLPELNDEFAKTYEAENLEKLKEGVRQDLERELQLTRSKSIRNQIVQKLLDRVDFGLPESVLEGETKNVIYDLVRENQQRGVSQSAIEAKKDEIYAYANNSAKDRVKSGFILNRIAEQENIEVSKEELGQRITALAYSYGIPVKQFVKDLQQRNGIPEIHEQVLIGKTLDFLEKNAAIEEVPPRESSEESAPEDEASPDRS